MNQSNEFCNTLDADKLIATAIQCLEQRLTYATGEKFISSRSVSDYLRLQLSQEINEVFAVLFLDNHHRLLAFEKMFNGTINEAVIYPRCVVQKALKYNAATIVVAHNHPSGVARPSSADEAATKDLKKILEIINVKLLDHFVITAKNTYSFAENGLL